jgi:hypothetical protein
MTVLADGGGGWEWSQKSFLVPVSTTFAVLVAKFAPGVVDTSVAP